MTTRKVLCSYHRRNSVGFYRRPFLLAYWGSAVALSTSTASSLLLSSSSYSSGKAVLPVVATVGTRSNFAKPTFIKQRPSLQQDFEKRHRALSNLFMSTASSPKNNDNENTSDNEKDNRIVRVVMCQFHVTEDKEINWVTASKYIDDAVTQYSPNIIVLPEIWNSPYATAAFPEYAEVLPNLGDKEVIVESLSSPSAELLQKKAIQHKVYIIGGSIPEKDSTGTKIYNTCLVFDPTGTIVVKHRKVHLFDISVPGGITFRESDTLTSGSTVSYFNYMDLCNIGIGICYDIRFMEYAALLCQQHNCKILIYPGAFNLTTGPAHWELLQRARANDNQCYVITASPARRITNNDDDKDDTKTKYPPYTAWGHSTAVGPWGDILATRDETEGIVVADLDLNKVESIRQSIPITFQKRTDLYQLVQEK